MWQIFHVLHSQALGLDFPTLRSFFRPSYDFRLCHKYAAQIYTSFSSFSWNKFVLQANLNNSIISIQ